LQSKHHNPPLVSGNGIAVITGVIVSQIAATFLVRSANLSLQREMTAIIDRGYLAVPSASIVAGLSSWFNASMGAFFFTVTTGIILIYLTLSVVRWVQAASWSISRQIGILAVLWLFLIVFINSTGLNNGATIYVSSLMASVIITGFATKPRLRAGKGPLRRIAWVFVPLILLTGLWLTKLNADLFANIRDRLLFSNPVGIAVVEFYYDYTLFGAQAMAPSSQHTMLAADLSTVRDDTDYNALSSALRRWDVLNVGEMAGVSAILTPAGEGIRWENPTGRQMTSTREDMRQRTDSVVKQFSAATDRNGPFRLITFAGILVGFPVMLYLGVFALVEGVLRRIAGRYATAATAIVCLLIGGALFYPLAAAPAVDASVANARTVWQEGTLAGRISVLKLAVRHNMDPLQFPGADDLAESTHLSERYWFARALGGSRSDRGFELLKWMMNDDNPLVICQVCYAFGRINNPDAVPLLLRYVREGYHWYAQRYAYAALKALGWIQPPRYR
jgi:hypothetical protein